MRPRIERFLDSYGNYVIFGVLALAGVAFILWGTEKQAALGSFMLVPLILAVVYKIGGR